MSRTTHSTYEPAIQRAAAARSCAKEPGLASQVEWKTVHGAVQKVFAEMVHQLGPQLETKSGFTEGTAFFFTYRLFQNPGDENIDPVVVGITFWKGETAIRIEGDISGEQTGDFLVDSIKDKVAASTDRVKAAALRIASKLVRHTSVVPQALRNKSRVVP